MRKAALRPVLPRCRCGRRGVDRRVVGVSQLGCDDLAVVAVLLRVVQLVELVWVHVRRVEVRRGSHHAAGAAVKVAHVVPSSSAGLVVHLLGWYSVMS